MPNHKVIYDHIQWSIAISLRTSLEFELIAGVTTNFHKGLTWALRKFFKKHNKHSFSKARNWMSGQLCPLMFWPYNTNVKADIWLGNSSSSSVCKLLCDILLGEVEGYHRGRAVSGSYVSFFIPVIASEHQRTPRTTRWAPRLWKQAFIVFFEWSCQSPRQSAVEASGDTSNEFEFSILSRSLWYCYWPLYVIVPK